MTILESQPLSARENCPVCGNYKLSHETYCTDCEKWKKGAEAKRANAARRRAFGEWL